MPAKRKYYWCSCVYIAWLKAEPGRVELCDGIVSEVEKGEAIIISSSIVETEVLMGDLAPDVQEKFRALLKRRDVVAVNVDRTISKLAGDLRDHYRGKKPKESISGMDAIHLATAILYKVDEFHTFEPKLIRYSGNLAGHQLVICEPRSKQPNLPFPAHPPAKPDAN